MQRMAVFLAVACLAACTRPYAEPEVTPARDFAGARSYVAEGQVPALRAILTHGMCSGDHRAQNADGSPSWLETRADELARALGGQFDPEAPRQVAYFPGGAENPDIEQVERHVVPIDTADGPVEAVFLIWGRHVDPYRAALTFENSSAATDPAAPQRARLNATLKSGLMNGCLIDAVVYLGENGDPIRAGMREAVCDTLGGRFAPARPAGDAGASATCGGSGARQVPTVLIPESLGSTILFEAITDLDSPPGLLRLADGTGAIRSIYMASNQLPLLRLGNTREATARALGGDATASGGGALEDLLSLIAPPQFRSADAGPAVAPPQVIAITDPNDLLGYRLDPELFDEPPYRDFEIRNVLVSNTPEVFGLIADPLEAHRGTASDTVFGLIANGWTAPPG